MADTHTTTTDRPRHVHSVVPGSRRAHQTTYVCSLTGDATVLSVGDCAALNDLLGPAPALDATPS